MMEHLFYYFSANLTCPAQTHHQQQQLLPDLICHYNNIKSNDYSLMKTKASINRG